MNGNQTSNTNKGQLKIGFLPKTALLVQNLYNPV